MRYEVQTAIDGEKINHVVSTEFQNVRQELYRQVIDTGEEQIRQALIALGWTPPTKNG